MSDVEYVDEESRVQERRPMLVTALSILRILRVNLPIIFLVTLCVAVGFVVLASVYALMQPVQRNASIGFRAEFPGADQGQYPNGLKFSGSDIIDTPILRTVFDANGLDRYLSFVQFSRAVVVLESNAALASLAREYEAKLASNKLTTVERERLEAEFRQKQASLQKSDFSLNFAWHEGMKRVPHSVSSKVLYDILRNWAEFTATRRQVLVHRVPLVSQQTIARQASATEVLPALLYLRVTATEVRKNIEALETLPGSEVMRSEKRRMSLSELALELAQIQRGGIEYLLASALRVAPGDRSRAIALLESQLTYDRRQLRLAEERISVMRAALDDYLRKGSETRPRIEGETTDSPSGEGVVPYVSDTFLDRVVALAQNASDQQYRQKYTDEIRAASLSAVPLRAMVEYEENLLGMLRQGNIEGGAALAPEVLRAEYVSVVRSLQQIATDLEDIRTILSRSLSPAGQLYTVTRPPVHTVERSVSLMKLVLAGIALTFATAILMSAIVVLRELLARADAGAAQNQ